MYTRSKQNACHSRKPLWNGLLQRICAPWRSAAANGAPSWSRPAHQGRTHCPIVRRTDHSAGRECWGGGGRRRRTRSEEHTSELQSRENLVCRLLLEKKKHK